MGAMENSVRPKKWTPSLAMKFITSCVINTNIYGYRTNITIRIYSTGVYYGGVCGNFVLLARIISGTPALIVNRRRFVARELWSHCRWTVFRILSTLYCNTACDFRVTSYP